MCAGYLLHMKHCARDWVQGWKDPASDECDLSHGEIERSSTLGGIQKQGHSSILGSLPRENDVLAGMGSMRKAGAVPAREQHLQSPGPSRGSSSFLTMAEAQSPQGRD